MININNSPKQQLIEVLHKATSHSQEVLKAAVEQLKSWETENQFYPTLQDIAYDINLDPSLRQQAIIYLKNGIERCWRKSSFNTIPTEDKIIIRNRLLTQIGEKDKLLSKINGVIISTIARIDYPGEWPDLISNIIQLIKEANQSNEEIYKVAQRNSLKMLQMIVKELSSKVIMSGKKVFKEITPELGKLIIPLYTKHYNQLKLLFQQVGDFNKENLSKIETLVIEELDFCFLTLKALRPLIASGTPDFSEIDTFKEFFINSIADFRDVYELTKSLNNFENLLEHFIKFCELNGKLYLEIQRQQPIPFVNAEGWLQLMHLYWQILNEQSAVKHMEKCCIQAMLLFRDTIANYSYMIEAGDEPSKELLKVRENIDVYFMTKDIVIKLIELLIIKYISLKPDDDLYLWENDPEAWITEDEVDHWEFSYRKCSERLLCSVIKKYKSWAGPMLINILEEFKEPKNTLEEVLIKDAVYNGIGLAAHELFSLFSFDDWFEAYLSIELMQTGPGYVILRNRIVWLIGQWVSVKLAKSRRKIYYETILYIISSEHERPQSIITRWTASKTLKYCIDDWDFEADDFAPYLSNSIDQLISLLSNLSELELKMKVVQTLSIIVERMESKITPFAAKIAGLLPALWDSAGPEDNLLKSSIVNLLTRLTKSLGPISENLHDMIQSVVQQSVDLDQPTHVYLLEDGLELWLTALKNTPNIRPQLVQLVPYIIRLLDSSSETLKMCFKIISFYLILASDDFINAFGISLFQNLGILLLSLKSEATIYVAQLLELVIQTCSLQYFKDGLVQTGLFRHLIQASSNLEELAYVQVSFLTALARLVIKDPYFFYMAILDTYQENSKQVLSILIQNWTEKFDNMPSLKSQKLTSLAWSNLLAVPINHPNLPPLIEIMFNNLSQFFTGWSGILCDIHESEEGDALAYHDDTTLSDYEDDNIPTNNIIDVERRKELIEKDPAHSIPLRKTIIQKLFEAEINYDQFMIQQNLSLRFIELKNKIDPKILNEIYEEPVNLD